MANDLQNQNVTKVKIITVQNYGYVKYSINKYQCKCQVF